MPPEPADSFPSSLFTEKGAPAAASPLIAAQIPQGWRDQLSDEVSKPYFVELMKFVDEQRKSHQVFPEPQDVFNALQFTSYAETAVLILGQDPYHDTGQAHGLCFSVREGHRPPPSLVNIFKELKTDVGIDTPRHGCLTRWAEQGVLLLNAVLTVRAHEPNSHKDKGWETFTDAIIRKISARPERAVFVLWGGYAGKKEKLIDPARHTIIKSAHPSPLSASNGFFTSRPFSRINAALRGAGKAEIDWRVEESEK